MPPVAKKNNVVEAKKAAAAPAKKAAAPAKGKAAAPAKGKPAAAPAKTAPKKAAAAPPAPRKRGPKPAVALWSVKPKPKGIGQGIPAKRDLTRFVRWPRYIRLQRQRRVLYNRLKVPPGINQFTLTADKNLSTSVFNLLSKYKTETVAQKTARLKAAAKEGGKPTEATKKPCFVKCGVNHVTALVENKKAKLVVIAHDVDPIEIVIHLPTLCRKLDVPYIIVKGKSKLGTFVNKKTATCLAFTDVHPEHTSQLALLVASARDSFNNNVDSRRTWGGLKLGIKSLAVIHKRQKLAAREAARKVIKKEEKVEVASNSKSKAKEQKKLKAKAAADANAAH